MCVRCTYNRLNCSIRADTSINSNIMSSNDSDKKPPAKRSSRKRSYGDKPSVQEKTYRMHHKTFPQKLYEILMKPELNPILSFLPSGQAWRVHNKARFESEVMGLYFESNKWASFLRQATGWGFKRSEYT